MTASEPRTHPGWCDDIDGELWRDVPGFESYYQVSSLGRVRSLPRTVPVTGQCPRRLRPYVLKPAIRISDGRRHVALCRDGRAITRSVDALMREVGFR